MITATIVIITTTLTITTNAASAAGTTTAYFFIVEGHNSAMTGNDRSYVLYYVNDGFFSCMM